MLRKTLLLLMFLTLFFTAPNLHAQNSDGREDGRIAGGDNEFSRLAMFPHPGPYDDFWIYEVLGFEQGYRLFRLAAGRSSSSNNLSLYYLALSLGMLGLILIILNKKFQEPATMGCWFIVTFIVLIGPYGSKLFFYPLNVTSVGGEEIHAFTPQLAAIHITNLLHTAVHDVLFACRRDSNNGASCNVRNGVSDVVNVSAINSLGAGRKRIDDPAMFGMMHTFSSLCGAPELLLRAPYDQEHYNVADVFYSGHDESAIMSNSNMVPPNLWTRLPAPEENATVTNENGLISTDDYYTYSQGFTLADVLRTIQEFYAADLHNRDSYSPYAVLFKADPNNTSNVPLPDPADAPYLGDDIAAWQNGMIQYQELGNVERSANNGNNNVNASNAVEEIAFYLANPANPLYGPGDNATFAEQARRKKSASSLAPDITSDDEDNVTVQFEMQHLSELFRNRSLLEMPVKVSTVAVGYRAEGTWGQNYYQPAANYRNKSIWGMQTSGGYDQTALDKVHEELHQPAANCAELHRVIHTRLVMNVYDNLDTESNIAGTMIYGDHLPDYFIQEPENGGIMGWFAIAEKASLREHMRMILEELNRTARDFNRDADQNNGVVMKVTTSKNPREEGFYRELLNGSNGTQQNSGLSYFLRTQLNSDLLRNAMQASPALRTIAAETSSTARRDPLISGTQADTVMGWAAGPVAAIGGWIAEIGVMIFSWIAGAIAPIYIKFILLISKIAVMAALMMTPLLMLMGIAIPGNAPGVLILTIGSIFILKFIPITYTIVDAIFTLVMDLVRGLNPIGASLGDSGGQLMAGLGGGAGIAAVGAVAMTGGLALIPIAVGAGIGGSIGVLGLAGDSVERSLVVLAAAMAYTSATGITMFLLFKVGDPTVLQNLTQLDDLAKKPAEQAVDATQKGLMFGAKNTPAVGSAAAFGAVAGYREGGKGIKGVFSGAGAGLKEGSKTFMGRAAKELGFDGEGLIADMQQAGAKAEGNVHNEATMKKEGFDNPVSRMAKDFIAGKDAALKQELETHDRKYATIGGEVGLRMRESNAVLLGGLQSNAEAREHIKSLQATNSNGILGQGFDGNGRKPIDTDPMGIWTSLDSTIARNAGRYAGARDMGGEHAQAEELAKAEGISLEDAYMKLYMEEERKKDPNASDEEIREKARERKDQSLTAIDKHMAEQKENGNEIKATTEDSEYAKKLGNEIDAGLNHVTGGYDLAALSQIAINEDGTVNRQNATTVIKMLRKKAEDAETAEDRDDLNKTADMYETAMNSETGKLDNAADQRELLTRLDSVRGAYTTTSEKATKSEGLQRFLDNNSEKTDYYKYTAADGTERVMIVRKGQSYMENGIDSKIHYARERAGGGNHGDSSAPNGNSRGNNAPQGGDTHIHNHEDNRDQSTTTTNLDQSSSVEQTGPQSAPVQGGNDDSMGKFTNAIDDATRALKAMKDVAAGLQQSGATAAKAAIETRTTVKDASRITDETNPKESSD